METKTHWQQSPNRNYLGHQDLPNGENVTLTLKSGKWEVVENKKLFTKVEKRVLRFEEQETLKWVKPFICNETNALDICKKLQIQWIEDSIGAKITFTIKEVKFGDIVVKALRVLHAKKEDVKTINEKERDELQELIDQAGKDIESVCNAYKIDNLLQFPVEKFHKTKKRLEEIIKEKENAENN